MKSLEDVLKGIEVCLSGGLPDRCNECPYHHDGCDTQKMKDAYSLLKAQKQVIDQLYSILDETCRHVRESTEEDYVCGLCQYDGAYKGDSGDWCNECPGFELRDCFAMKNEIRRMCGKELLPEP